MTQHGHRQNATCPSTSFRFLFCSLVRDLESHCDRHAFARTPLHSISANTHHAESGNIVSPTNSVLRKGSGITYTDSSFGRVGILVFLLNASVMRKGADGDMP